MEYIQLNKFIDLLKYQLIDDNTFCDFLEDLNNLIQELKKEIKVNWNQAKNKDYRRYANEEIITLQKFFEDPALKVTREMISKYFFNTNTKYYRIDDILKMHKETKLYEDLSFPHMRANDQRLLEYYYDIQRDFLGFTKSYFITEIIKCFKFYMEKVKEEDFPDFFKSLDDYKKFEIYVKKEIITPLADLSYLFQRMLREDKIIKIPHKKFMFWLKESDFIKEKQFDELLKNGCLLTESKSKSEERINKYNNIFF